MNGEVVQNEGDETGAGTRSSLREKESVCEREIDRWHKRDRKGRKKTKGRMKEGRIE